MNLWILSLVILEQGEETSYSIPWLLSYDPKNNYPKQIIRKCVLHRSFLSLKLNINFKINEASQSDKKYTQENAVLCLGTQSCPTLYNHMDCSLPGSSVPGDSPGWNIGMGCHALLQEIFPTQGSNPGLLHCRQILYQQTYQGSPIQENILLQKDSLFVFSSWYYLLYWCFQDKMVLLPMLLINRNSLLCGFMCLINGILTYLNAKLTTLKMGTNMQIQRYQPCSALTSVNILPNFPESFSVHFKK